MAFGDCQFLAYAIIRFDNNDIFPWHQQINQTLKYSLFIYFKLLISRMQFVCLLHILSTVQQIRVSWALAGRKTAPWNNYLLEKIGKSMLYWLVFTAKAPVRRFHSVSVSTRGQCKRFEISWLNPLVITKVSPLGSLTLVVLIKKELKYLLLGFFV